MVETSSQPERMGDENEFIDLTDSMNSATLEEIKQRGPVGAFIAKLVEKGIAEKQKVLVHGMNSLTLRVRYGNDQANFMLKPSVDQGDAPITHAHYELRMVDYKKPWVRDFIKPEDSKEWLRIMPINFAGLCEELTGRDLRLFTLEEQFPKLSYNNMKDAISEETPELDQLFSYKSGMNAGAWGFYLEFKSQEDQKKYLENDPQLMASLKTMVEGFVPRIMARLAKMQAQKAA